MKRAFSYQAARKRKSQDRKGICFYALNGARDEIDNMDNEEARDALNTIDCF